MIFISCKFNLFYYDIDTIFAFCYSYPFKAKAPSYEIVSQKIVEDTVNLLFEMISVPFSHDVYKTVKALKETVIIQVLFMFVL